MKDFFDTQNDLFLDFINRIFEINKCKTWEDVSKKVTITKVKRTYRLFASLFPRKHDYLKELEKLKSSSANIHYSGLKANRIINEVVRFSLYSEKIIVFHPLQNPCITKHSIDPRKNANYWLPDFLDSLYFYIVIQKWVKAGIVKLIINPYDYDFDLRDKIDKKAKERVFKQQDEKKIKEFGEEIIDNHMAEHLAIFYKNKDKKYIIKSLLEMEQFSEEEAEKFSEKILSAMSRINPIYNKIDKNLLKEKALIPYKGGGPVESLILISEITKANIYTPSNFNWSLLQELGIDDFWTKTDYLYHKLPLNFLNNVDTGFALKLREENKLYGVRKELENIYKELKNIDINDLHENKIKYMQEGFIDALNRAESEWLSIKKEAEASRNFWFTTNLGNAFIQEEILENSISILPLIFIGMSQVYKAEKDTNKKLNLFKVKNPISVYVDLKHKRQGFFTKMKNCIF